MEIDSKIIQNILDKGGFSWDSKEYSPELKLHESIAGSHGTEIVRQSLDSNDVLMRYMLGAHHLNKIKRTDPNQKIIDAYDIDWSGYGVTINGKHYQPKTTFELLDLIFRLIQYLFSLNGDEDLVWNDTGAHRLEENRMYWGDSEKIKETDQNDVSAHDWNAE